MTINKEISVGDPINSTYKGPINLQEKERSKDTEELFKNPPYEEIHRSISYLHSQRGSSNFPLIG